MSDKKNKFKTVSFDSLLDETEGKKGTKKRDFFELECVIDEITHEVEHDREVGKNLIKDLINKSKAYLKHFD